MAESSSNLSIEQVFHNDLHSTSPPSTGWMLTFQRCPTSRSSGLKIGESYLPDGMREFGKYPTVSLGWIMFIGMAIAKYWDEDWELYSKVEDLYKYLRDRIDFDHMDDYICEKVLCLDAKEHEVVNNVVGECAARTYNTLCRMRLEAGSKEAFRTFVAALHQMYLMGIAVELRSLGYHMTKI